LKILPCFYLGRQMRFSGAALLTFVESGGKRLAGVGGWRKDRKQAWNRHAPRAGSIRISKCRPVEKKSAGPGLAFGVALHSRAVDGASYSRKASTGKGKPRGVITPRGQGFLIQLHHKHERNF